MKANWTILKTEAEYDAASMRLMEIFHAPAGSEEQAEMELLSLLIQHYDEAHYQIPELDPLEAIKCKMTELGLKNKDLEPVIGSKGHVSAVLSGKRDLTLKMAQRLKSYLKLPASVFLP
jgi:HTH-type transcriptional regulator/antitoxin HigA